MPSRGDEALTFPAPAVVVTGSRLTQDVCPHASERPEERCFFLCSPQHDAKPDAKLKPKLKHKV